MIVRIMRIRDHVCGRTRRKEWKKDARGARALDAQPARGEENAAIRNATSRKHAQTAVTAGRCGRILEGHSPNRREQRGLIVSEPPTRAAGPHSSRWMH